MSDWEEVPDTESNQPMQQASSSDWEEVQQPPTSMQKQPQESLGLAALKAPFRIGEDIYRGGMNVLKSIPGYYQSGKTEIPGLLNTLKEHPGHVFGQGVAGLAELGQNVFNMPYDIANYATNRLNLIPGNINQAIQMGRMPSDTQQMINQTFGEPKYLGEKLTRGAMRNALNIIGASKIADIVNPMNLTAKRIANDILNTEKQQIKSHSKMYNNIWDQADKTGFNSVPYNSNLLTPYSSLIEKFYPEKSTLALKDFMNHPTLQNAQKAQSDLGNLRRSLEEKSRTTPLLETEKYLHDALSGAEKHIEGSMFKNAAGETNEALKKKYQKVTNSYRENVVPYKYNPSIQAYKNNEMLPNELVNSLSRGEFAAKKGNMHPEIKMRNMLKPALAGLGLLGGANWLYNEMMGNQPQGQNQNQ